MARKQGPLLAGGATGVVRRHLDEADRSWKGSRVKRFVFFFFMTGDLHLSKAKWYTEYRLWSETDLSLNTSSAAY